MSNRIEAIRERYSNAASEWVREDVSWLLAEVERLSDLERRDAFRVAFVEGRERIAELEAEVERLTDGPEVSAATGRPHPAVLKLRETRRQRDEALEHAADEANRRREKYLESPSLSMDWVAGWHAAVDDITATLRALAPVAPDAERVDHAAEHHATTGSDHCWCAE